MKHDRSRTPPTLVLASCVAALGSAYVAQYGFGLQPCFLCLVQRVPFAAAAVLALMALAASPRRARGLVRLAGAVLLLNGAIAVYHVGVEQFWWASAVCAAGDAAGPMAVDDLAAAMSRPVEAACDRPAWSFHGITMATMNVGFSTGLGLLTLMLTRRDQFGAPRRRR